MKKAILSLSLLIVTASVLFSRSFTEPDPTLAVNLQHAIESFYPRLEGAAGGKATIGFIEDTLRSAGVVFSEQQFSGLEKNHSFSRIVSVTISGALPDTLIVAVPINNALDAPKGSAGEVNIAAALELARSLWHNPPPLTVRILFLGAEVPLVQFPADPVADTGTPYPLGSRLFLSSYFPDGPVAVVYLDFTHAATPVSIEPGGGNSVAPSWLIRSTIEAAQEAGFGFDLAANRLLAYRLSRAESKSPIAPYLEQGIPAVLLTTRVQAVPTDATLWYRQLFAFIGRFLNDHASGLPTDWDHHYLMVDAGGTYLFYGEKLTLVVLMLVAALALLYAVARRKRILRYARTIMRNFWNLPALLAIMFLFLLISTVLIQSFLDLRDFPTLWQHYPLLFFAWKISLSLFLSTLSFRLLRRLPISRNGSFYSASALFFLLVDVVIAAVINLSFANYFLYAFILSFLFSITRSRTAKLLFFAAAPLLLLKAAWDALTIAELQLVQSMLLSPFRGNLLLAFVTLPFLLMVIRLDFLVRHPVRGRTSFATLLAMTATGIATVVLAGFLIFQDPFSEADPQPVNVIQEVNRDAGTDLLSLTSPAPLGNLSFTYGGNRISLSGAGRTFRTTLPTGVELLDASRTMRAFLGREQTALAIRTSPAESTSMRLYRVSVSLESAEPLLMYDSGFPFSYTEENRKVVLQIGVDPPNPLQVDYTLPAGKSPAVTLMAIFLGLPKACVPENPAYRFTSRTVVSLVLPPPDQVGSR
ncbi:MAG TPA: hypothetical protein VMW87_03290 [Spirochaetia bacterium]|nr:hypothetical protein [Spirochaetia bacterium]